MLIVFGGVISLVLLLVLERHVQVVSESDHNNLIIILSLRSESDHLQCLIRSHFRSCSGDLKPAEEKQDEPVYVQVKKDDNRSAYDRKKNIIFKLFITTNAAIIAIGMRRLLKRRNSFIVLI